MASDRVKMGLVGCGKWGRHVLSTLVELGVDVTVVARSKESIERASASGGPSTVIIHSVKDFPPDLKGIVIVSNTRAHYENIEEVAHFNVPMFVEKPMTARIDQASQLCDRYRDRLYVLEKYRHHPTIQQLAAIANDSRPLGLKEPLGNLVGVAVDFSGPADPVEPDTIWQCMPHALSIAHAIYPHVYNSEFGTLESLDARACMQRSACVVESKSGDGMTALLNENRVWIKLCVSRRRSRTNRNVTLYFENGVVDAVDFNNSEAIYACTNFNRSGPVEPVKYTVPATTGLTAMENEMVEVLQRSKLGPAYTDCTLVSAQLGARSVAIIGALRKRAGMQRIWYP